MPITKTLTPEQALKRIADVCALQKDNIAKSEQLVADSFATTNSPDGPNVRIHRNVLEAIASALANVADAADLNITIG